MVVAESILYLPWNLLCAMATDEMTTVQSPLKEHHGIVTQPAGIQLKPKHGEGWIRARRKDKIKDLDRQMMPQSN